MNLKIATIDDFSVVYKMAMAFATSSGYEDFIDGQKIYNIVNDFLTSPNEHKIIFLHGTEGMLVAMAIPFTFGQDYIATEVAWWVEPKARKKNIGKQLIDAFEAWGKKIGCKAAVVSGLDDSLSKFYEKNNYKLYERAYLKVL